MECATRTKKSKHPLDVECEEGKFEIKTPHKSGESLSCDTRRSDSLQHRTPGITEVHCPMTRVWVHIQSVDSRHWIET